MRDLFVLQKCIPDFSPEGRHENIGSLYEKYYPHGDFSYSMDDMTGIFSDFSSSPLIEMFKQNATMTSFISECMLNKDLYTEAEIDNNKCVLMTFFITINNLFKRLFLVDNKAEFLNLFTKIHENIFQFTRETIPRCSFGKSSVFSNTMIRIIDYSFNTSLRNKCSILSVLRKNILNNTGGCVDEDKIRREIERVIME